MKLRGLTKPWQLCFLLAWEALRAGSVAVGAVVLDETTGEVLATGHCRRDEADAAEGEIAGSAIAHAEVNALAKVPTGVRGATLYTSLEPCVMCGAAARMAHIGTVRFAGPDPYWTGAERLHEVSEAVARAWPAREGPLRDAWGAWGLFGPLLYHLGRRRAQDDFLAACRAAFPRLCALARETMAAGDPRRLTLAQGLETFGDQVATVGLH